MTVNPSPDHVLHAGDRIVLVGTESQVEKASHYVGLD
jgi:K+/H+ antiporter YhaU regulatory subunit KhtT